MIERPVRHFWGVLLVGWAAACGGAPATVSGPTDKAANPAAAIAPQDPASAPIAQTVASPVHPASQEIAEAPGAPELLPGAAEIKREDWGKARTELDAAMKTIAASQGLDVIMAGHALLGRACDRLDDRRCAAREFAAVAALWKDPSAAMKKLDTLGGDEAVRNQRLVRALLAQGEALYFFAEQKRREVEQLPVPLYPEQGNREEVLEHITTKLADWSRKKQELIEDAEKAYLKVVEIQPAPPPRWVIDSAARVGAMWGEYVLAFQARPWPRGWSGSDLVPGGSGLTYEELRQLYLPRITVLTDSFRRRARVAFQKCQNEAARYQYTDELSMGCDDWLASNPP